MKKMFVSFACLIILVTASAQKDPEFPKGWVLYLAEHHGVATNFTNSPDLFISGLRLTPQATIIPGHLRIGGTAGAIFNNKKLYGTFGPNLALKLATINVKNFGSILNVQLQGEYLWGTSQQRLIGGLLNFEVGQIASIGLSSHRDYALNVWWFQFGFGYNLAHKKKSNDPVDPMK